MKPFAGAVKFRDHLIVIVEAGEEWNADNECYCRLYRAHCIRCAAQAEPRRTSVGAIRRYQQRYQYRDPYSGLTRQLPLELNASN